MLPFLKQDRKQTGVLVHERKPDHQDKDGEGEQGLMECAKDIMSAIQSGNHQLLASALKAAFEICDSESSDEEGSDVEPHSYEAQNIKASRE